MDNDTYFDILINDKDDFNIYIYSNLDIYAHLYTGINIKKPYFRTWYGLR